MQTLNVGAGQSDAEYKESKEQQRKDLLSDARDAANYFFWAAGLAALGTGLLPIRINMFVSIGCFDLVAFYGRSLGSLYPAVLYGFALFWVAVMAGLGRWTQRTAVGVSSGYLDLRHGLDRAPDNFFNLVLCGSLRVHLQVVSRAKSAEGRE